MENLANNKLIAEFMGFKKDAEDLYLIDDYNLRSENQFQATYVSEMEFHTSWDWLMPVVEKIETLGYTFEKNYQQIDRDWQCLIVKGNDILHQEFDRKSLNAAHYVVVEFIKQQKKQ
jgi:hypothetical protein